MASKDKDHHHRHHSNDVVDRTFDDYTLYIGNDQMNRYPGSDHMDFVFGRAGNDRLLGGDHDDDLLGGRGNDRLMGAAGMDHLDGGRGNDRLFGGAEMDGLRGAEGNDYLDEGAGHGDLEGGPGNDILVGGLGADAFMVDPDSGHDVIKDFKAGPGMFDHLALRNIAPEELRFEDTEAGVLISWNGGESSVLLEGVFKQDLAQDDFMFTENPALIPVGGFEATEAQLSNSPDSFIFASQTNSSHSRDTYRFDEFRVEIGTEQADSFGGTGARDYFIGLGGDDQLSGGEGDDDLQGDAGNDILRGEGGMNRLAGGEGDDELYGGDMSDTLMGGEGSDYLAAGASHDMLDAGMGDDTLDGGGGADAFIVNPTSGNDVVAAGFTPGAGAFDHIAFINILPDQVTVADTAEGALISWGTGSILLQGIAETELVQDDFMFNNVEGGAFVADSEISSEGSSLIFPPELMLS